MAPLRGAGGLYSNVAPGVLKKLGCRYILSFDGSKNAPTSSGVLEAIASEGTTHRQVASFLLE